MTTWFAGDDDIGRRRASAFSRRDAPELCIESFGPEKNERAQGMPGGQCTRSLVCENKQTHELVTTVTPGQPGIPYTMVLRLTSCSPRRSGLFVTVAGGYLFRQLDAGVEASEPHDLAVRKIGALVLALPASTASRPSSVTIAKRPSVGRDARDIKVILVKREREYFCKRGLDRPSRKTRTDLPVGQNQIDRFTEFAERDDVSAAAVYSLVPHFAGRGLG